MSTQNPSDNRYQELEARLVRMESKLRWFKWCAVLVVMAGCSLGAAAAVKEPAKKEVYVEKLRVGTLEVKTQSTFGDEAGEHVIIGGGSIFVKDATRKQPSYLAIFNSNVMISGQDEVTHVFSNGLVVNSVDHRINREYREMMKLSAVGFSETERKRFLTLQESRLAKTVSIGVGGEAGGGMITLYSALRKEVVSIQANKGNAGVIYLKDVNGKTQKAYTAD